MAYLNENHYKTLADEHNKLVARHNKLSEDHDILVKAYDNVVEAHNKLLDEHIKFSKVFTNNVKIYNEFSGKVDKKLEDLETKVTFNDKRIQKLAFCVDFEDEVK